MDKDRSDSGASRQMKGTPPSTEENHDDATHEFYVPDNFVEDLASMLVTQCKDPREALFNLASMCCVCRQWRTVACRVDQEFHVVLDSFTGNRTPSGSLSHRFKRVPLEEKIQFFLGVSTGGSLRRISISSTGAVSDKAITILVLICSGLQHFSLDDVHLRKNGIGAFLGCLLKTCSGLSKRLASISYVVTKTIEASYVIDCVDTLPLLETLELLVKGCRLSAEQLAAVDIPISISFCGASSLSHEVVGSILLLPLLTGLDISGCGRLNAMDKMRLVSKARLNYTQQNLNQALEDKVDIKPFFTLLDAGQGRKSACQSKLLV
ncbi:hypothetical protein BSKO_07222 [Bryopsis sp. KO-2023]|nr:hypothetical protein BSKO_07222 [Bryopsis sp. KO-2023]